MYFGHRRGAVILPRYLKSGKSLDHNLSYRQFQIKDTLDAVAPMLSMKFMGSIINNIQRDEFGTFDPQWRLHPPPSLLHQNPTVTESLIAGLRDGTVISTHAPKRITGDWSVELQDGTFLDIDSIVYCTGYSFDYEVLGKHDPTLDSSASNGHNIQTPRLYQNIFSIDFPESLAFVGIAIIIFPAFLLSDLSSMAIAQLWSNRIGSPVLPPKTEMEQWYARHLSYVDSIRALSPDRKFVKLSVQSRKWLPWIMDQGGCNIDHQLGWFSLESWELWWKDRELHNILSYGIWSPHIFRMFESSRPGGRKKWDGAREAIIRVNEDVQARVNKHKTS